MDRDEGGRLGYVSNEGRLSGGEDPMGTDEVRRFWNENADLWTRLSRAGYDVYRDHLNTPAFLEMLPDVEGLSGLDVGCGEGHNTRLLAERGALVTAIDLSEVFIEHARSLRAQGASRIRYLVASALKLPFAEMSFDFATGIMSFMDIPGMDRVLADIYRVLRPGAFLQFSITHPCFETPHCRTLRDEKGRPYARAVGGYFRNLRGDVIEIGFGAAPPEIRQGKRTFEVPRFNRTLSEWLNMVMESGFILERVEEPRPSDAAVRQHPRLQGAQVVACFLHTRARKPTAGTGGS